MFDNRNDKDPIEGDYEIIDERDVYEEQYGQPDYSGGGYYGGSFISLDKRPPYVTYVLLGINILAWILMTLTGYIFGWDLSDQLLVFGAKVNIFIAYGQYWRLLSAMFLHVGIVHLFFNSYALYANGPVVESLFGKAKFAAVYLLSGLIGSIFSYVFSPNASAGASGAIFGLLGSLLYFRRRNKEIFSRVFGSRLMMVIGINLFYGFVQPGIDNWGHIGGMIGGYLVANAVGLYRENGNKGKKLMFWMIILTIFILGLWFGRLRYANLSNLF